MIDQIKKFRGLNEVFGIYAEVDLNNYNVEIGRIEYSQDGTSFNFEELFSIKKGYSIEYPNTHRLPVIATINPIIQGLALEKDTDNERKHFENNIINIAGLDWGFNRGMRYLINRGKLPVPVLKDHHFSVRDKLEFICLRTIVPEINEDNMKLIREVENEYELRFRDLDEEDLTPIDLTPIRFIKNTI